MIPGTPILVRATAERRVGSVIEARVGSDTARLHDHDIVADVIPDLSPRRHVRYRGDGLGTVWRVLCADGDTLFIRSGRLHAIAREAWVEDVSFIDRNAA